MYRFLFYCMECLHNYIVIFYNGMLLMSKLCLDIGRLKGGDYKYC